MNKKQKEVLLAKFAESDFLNKKQKEVLLAKLKRHVKVLES